MMARAAPSPSSNQPLTLPARRTTSVPSVAYRTAAGAAHRLVTLSEIARSPNARTVSTAPASDTAVTRTHAAAVTRLEPITGEPPPALRPVSPGGATELTCATT
jgi:hypothetical protein